MKYENANTLISFTMLELCCRCRVFLTREKILLVYQKALIQSFHNTHLAGDGSIRKV